MSTKYVLHQSAYVKLILHALKYPSQAVNGVLLGTVPNAGNSSKLSSSEIVAGTAIEIIDAVPLFHNHLGLAPMLEMAVTQVDEYYSSQKPPLQIVGYYHANERSQDVELGSIARQIASSIARHCPQACALLVHNELLRDAGTDALPIPALQLHVRDGMRGWRPAGGMGGGPGGPSAEVVLRQRTDGSILRDYIQEKRYHLLCDFDDHLDDISRDWLNPRIFD